jgi:hypothetical protein
MKFSEAASAQARALCDRWAGAPFASALAISRVLAARLSTEHIAPPRVLQTRRLESEE